MASDNSRQHNNQDFQLTELFNVNGKVALVTGGGSGIGLMAVQALAVNGAKVYICGRTEEKLDTVAKTYTQDIPGQIIPIVADVSKKDDVKKLYSEIAQKEEKLDILVNNAGISTTTVNTEAGSADELKAALFDNEEVTYEDWAAVYSTNVSQIYFMTTAFLPLLQKAAESQHGSSGSVINIASISGQVMTTQHHPQYNASKAAAIHLSRMLAHEVQKNGLTIRINDISPGVFPSEMTTQESGANQKSHIPKEQHEGKTPAARPGNDRDMASAVLFVATNTFLNGQTITVDGGYTLVAGR
ncbi:short-chain dehydrogenase like [Lecanosticta acicola]|uniref:Short-chain dehydrogenase like n=1 Tax=Lecanosticta acicola TaxID=111012 RepID=A0AAI8Z1T5_9PEZI|nr:short-chain dehydrogenase like [Lecanosticta acicola]